MCLLSSATPRLCLGLPASIVTNFLGNFRCGAFRGISPANERKVEEAQAVEVLEAAFDGEDLQIAFNPQYLLDGIGAIDSDTARISFTSPAKPAVITGKSEGEGEPDYRYVLMPIRSAA